ncbi:hypothetical protein [Paraburkholderia sp. GAS348]|uniref:hypothetical protein n=1 Tax=Paraburkholderia sp. GAS348 TaxID=3035132 RepID=UPI003D244892
MAGVALSPLVTCSVADRGIFIPGATTQADNAAHIAMPDRQRTACRRQRATLDPNNSLANPIRSTSYYVQSVANASMRIDIRVQLEHFLQCSPASLDPH